MVNQNPYHPLSPPDDPTLFYGRQEAIAFLRQNLVGANHREMLVILGRVGMGKTSLLHHTAFIVDERYQTVYVDMSGIKLDDETTLLLHIAQSIVSRMEVIRASTYRLPAFPEPDTPAAEVREWFAKDFLEVVLTAIRRDRFLLLLLDDVHLLFQALELGSLPDDFITYLGGLLDHHERLGMLAAIDVAYEERALHHPPTANLNFHLRLGHLEEDAARQLVVDPVEGIFRYTDDTLERILFLCGGYPFLIHSVCRLIYRLYEGNPHLTLITPQLIEHVYAAVMEETGEVMDAFWKTTTPNMRAVLQVLLDFYQQDPLASVPVDEIKRKLRPVALNQTQLVSQLRGLEYQSIIKSTTESTYSFSTGLEAEWLLINWEEATPQKSFKAPSRTRLIGAGAVITVFLVMGILLMAGVFEGGGEAPPKGDAPPTSTFALDMDATRRSESASQTAQAVPSATITPSSTPSITPTRTPSDTPSPSDTASLTATPTRTRTPTNTPTDTASPTPTNTRRPFATPSEAPNATRTPRR